MWKEHCVIAQDMLTDIAAGGPSPAKDTRRPPPRGAAPAAPANAGAAAVADARKIAVPASLALKAPAVASKGALTSLLEKERLERTKKSCTVGRHSRFGGQFAVRLPPASAAAGGAADDVEYDDVNGGGDGGAAAKPSTKPTSIMIRRPFDNGGDCHGPQAKLKRGKKNLTFAPEDPYLDVAAKFDDRVRRAFVRALPPPPSLPAASRVPRPLLSSSLPSAPSHRCVVPLAQEVTGQRACVVAATVADRICVGMGLKQLVLRVNEDLRRDEHIVGNEQELVYFQVTTSRACPHPRNERLPA